MGFTAKFHYYTKKDNDYDKENPKEMTRKIGDAYDDIPLEELASKVLAQLARRDIFIFDVEIYEYAKKKITFKESSDGGILIKNKKFSLDTINIITQEAISSEEPKPLPPNELANRASNLGKVKTWMVFDPEIPLVAEARQKGLKFTISKKYPIYQLSEHPMGLQYGNVLTTVDDTNRQITVSDKYFIPANINLVGDKEVQGGFSSAKGRPNNEPKLAFDGEIEAEVPVLRSFAKGAM